MEGTERRMEGRKEDGIGKGDGRDKNMMEGEKEDVRGK